MASNYVDFRQLPLSLRERVRGEGILSTLLALWLAMLLFASPAEAGPRIEHWTLANGTRVYFVEAHDIPMVQLRLVFDSAASRDPVGKSGLALMTNRLLHEGAGGLDAGEIARRFERLGAEYGQDAGRDMAVVELRSLSEARLLQPALELLALIVRQPDFPAGAFERERARSLIALQRDLANPAAVVQKTFYRELYGSHPYAADPPGDPDSLKALTRDDLVAHYRRYYVGRNAVLVIVGDLTRRQANRMANTVAGDLPAGEIAAPLPKVTNGKGIKRAIAFPAKQTHVRIGMPVLVRNDPDLFPLYVGNYILGGGGLVSRLADEVREKRGYAYSVYSYFQPMREAGPFVLGLQTKNTQKADALKVVRRVLGEFIAKGPTAKELEDAKKHLVGGYPLKLAGNRKIADQVAYIAFYELPLDWLDTFTARVETVTVEQIRDAFQRRVRLNELVTVTVGGR